jgi:hypothetical protein
MTIQLVPDDLTNWTEHARRDDWHMYFVGSDIRCMLGEIGRLRKLVNEAYPVVTAACIVVAADTYKDPVLSREDAVKAGIAGLHDAVGKWHGAQPAAQCSPQDTSHD